MESTLFNKLVRTIQYDHQKKRKDFSQFMEELPYKLKDELKAIMHQKMYSHVNFFQNKDETFLAWISTVVKANIIEET